jgi:glycosyltransferase involved in cell wall biosynthesis
VRLAYAGATVFLFPSLAEGFGWPIAEAMASGCPVITTQEAPMTEVGAAAAFYLPRRPATGTAAAWASAGAHVVQQVVALSTAERQAVVAAGLANARRFEPAVALDQMETIYKAILASTNYA